jgi:uncharacterized membrane protein (DUF4010 family)
MDPATYDLVVQLGIALGLGLLVGLQRQYAESGLAGLRTFPLVTVLGTITAVLDRQLSAGGWVVAAAFLALTVQVAVANMARVRGDKSDAKPDFGLTTEAAILLMFALGAFVVGGDRVVAVVVGVAVAVLLQFKGELHGIVARLGADDLRAIMTFALISGIVLPLLPNQSYGPWDVFNPFQTWLVVVLIVGMSLAGYIVYKFFGANAGIVLGGILGGAISSTATTVSYARRTASAPDSARMSLVVILIASTVVYARVLIEISVVAPLQFAAMSVPIFILMAAGAVVAAGAWLMVRRQTAELPPQSNPTELRSALLFAAIYTTVLFALAAAREYVGQSGLVAVAAISGLTDMDAITISVSRLARAGPESGGVHPFDGALLIVVAAVANLAFKTGIVAVTAHRRLTWMLAAAFVLKLLVAFLGGLAYYGLVHGFAWPGGPR